MWEVFLFLLFTQSETFTHIGTSPLPVKGCKILAFARLRALSWEGYSYRVITAVTQDLGLQGLIRSTAMFSRLLPQARGTIRGQVVEFEAPSELRRGVEALIIKCSPSLDGFNFINRLEIKRKGTGEPAYSTVLEVFDPPRGSNPNFKDEKLGARATAEGRGGRVSGAFLSLTVPVDMVNCEDNASYQCKITHTGVNNQTLTVTSASVSVRMTANPSPTPPIFSLSPPNVPGTTDATYLKGTTIALVCSAEVGAPALSLRVCHHPLDSNSSSSAAKTLVDTVTPTSSEPSENCILSRTIVSTFTITDGSGTFTCEVHNATSACGGKNVYKPSTLSYTGIDYPVCNVSNASVAVTSTPVPEMTTINEVIIGGNVGPEVLASTATGGFTLLVLGCVLITLSGILFAVSVILFLKSKKLRQDAEVTMIRSTYDSVHFNTGSAPNYTSLDDLTQSPRRHPKLEKLDSDGYMVPSTNNPR